MPKIPFSIRRSGRYYFRRRARLHNGKDMTVTVSLSTCDAQQARERAAVLAAQFDKVRRAVNAYFNLNQSLEPAMIKGLFENELRHCLAQFVAEFHDESRDPVARVAEHRTMASAFDISQRPGTKNELTHAQRETLAKAGHDEMAVEWVAADLDRFCGKDSIADEDLELMAEGLGLQPIPAVIGRLRHIHLQARAEAHRLAAHFLDEDVQAAFDQEEALLTKRRHNGEPLTFSAPAAPPTTATTVSAPSLNQTLIQDGSRTPDACEFKTYHSRRFSEAIPDILDRARTRGHWKRGLAQYERVLRTFAWITGDKPLGDYNHEDVADYSEALLKMPRDYRPSKDFDRPYQVVARAFPVTKVSARSLNTVRRDLAYMSTAYEMLATKEWKPKVANTKVLDFSNVSLEKKKKHSQKNKRPAWKPEHMKCLFSAPLWTGGGGHLRRLDANAGTDVYHDAAYWLPILLYYTHATLNEIAGLRADEVHIDDVVPNLVIQDNDIRAEDGIDGGEKNENRGRMIPLHKEILRLGFPEYVRAIRAEGHAALFPELYLNEARIGGHQFSNIGWRHMREWIGLHMPIPRNRFTRKLADMHSIRSLGSSFYAKADVPDFMRADVMGHARTGTNGLHYSQREETHGLDQVLSEYLAFMARCIDISTDHLQPRPVKLLPLNHRSRTGKPRIEQGKIVRRQECDLRSGLG